MSAISNRIAALQDQIQDALADMKPRDRSMFIGLLLFGLFVAGGDGIDARLDLVCKQHTKVAIKILRDGGMVVVELAHVARDESAHATVSRNRNERATN